MRLIGHRTPRGTAIAVRTTYVERIEWTFSGPLSGEDAARAEAFCTRAFRLGFTVSRDEAGIVAEREVTAVAAHMGVARRERPQPNDAPGGAGGR